jgi:hypothetical protein
MAVTSYFTVIDALVALFGGNNNIVDLGDIEYVVFDGLPTSEEYPNEVLILGWDSDPEGDFKAADLNQDWADAKGSKRRDETVEIPCAAISHYGDGDAWKPCRDRAEAVLADVETRLRSTPDLGIPIDGVRQHLTAEYKPSGAYQEPAADTGDWFRMQFVVRVSTRV